MISKNTTATLTIGLILALMVYCEQTQAQETGTNGISNFKRNVQFRFDNLRSNIRSRLSREPIQLTDYQEPTHQPVNSKTPGNYSPTGYPTDANNYANVALPTNQIQSTTAFHQENVRNEQRQDPDMPQMATITEGLYDQQYGNQPAAETRYMDAGPNGNGRFNAFSNRVPASERLFQLEDEIARIRQENESLKRSNSFLRNELETNRTLLAKVQNSVDVVMNQVDEANNVNQTLRKRNSELEFQLTNQAEDAARLLGNVTSQLNELLVDEISDDR